jgi:DNA-directed RNA polymerase specialized sigma24 family protein
MDIMLGSRSRNEDETLKDIQGNLEAFDMLFSRYGRTLSLVAYRVLGNHEDAEDAVQNCLRTASDNVSRFGHEGIFRCWLVRVLMDEAVMLLNKTTSRNVSGAIWVFPKMLRLFDEDAKKGVEQVSLAEEALVQIAEFPSGTVLFCGAGDVDE